METELLSTERIVGEAVGEFDRLVLDIRDTPSTAVALPRLVQLLRQWRMRPAGGWQAIRAILGRHDLGRLLRNDPMVRRCQWRQPDADPYDIVEAFVMGWDDTPDALMEAEEPGPTVNAVSLNGGLGAAMRERRNMVPVFLAGAQAPGAAVLSLGAGRAPESDLLEPEGPLAIDRWMAVDAAAMDDAIVRRRQSSRVEWRTMPPGEFLDTARGVETFDFIYTVDALDMRDDAEAARFLEKAALLLRPNGKLLVSGFTPDLPALAYADVVLDWRPTPHGTAELDRIFKSMIFAGRLAWHSWPGASGHVAFGLVERLSWSG